MSNDTVRRIVARIEAAIQAKAETPPELVYTPPPGGYPEPRPSADFAAGIAAKQPQVPADDERCITSSEDADPIQHAAVETEQTDEQPQAEAPQTRSAMLDDASVPRAALPQPLNYQHLPTSPNLVVQRVVVRVPVKRPLWPVVAWWQQHEALRKQLLGLMVLLVLIAATWLG